MTANWLGLEGKVVVVTGAGGGIGQALARSFAEQGARLALIDRDAASMAGLGETLAQAAGIAPLLLGCDISSEEAVLAAAKRVHDTLGGADVLVNNAALLRPGGLDTLPLSEWNEQLSVNLTGYYLCSRAFGAHMANKGKGALVHIASISGTFPQAQSGAYSVTKAGVLMLSRQFAIEWGPKGIRSNAICPGMVETPMSAAFYADADLKERREAVVPLRRIGQPADMADAALFFASDRSSYVNGEELLLDGGYSKMPMSLIPRPGF
jgi:NAD(P)-dependent dehydrogenase (short-subunit alcohol dehydrogenase family)